MKIHHATENFKFSWVQGMWLFIGVMLAGGGVFASFCREENLVSSARILGGIMLAAGILNFAVCEGKNRNLHGAHWLIADGLCAVFLSLFPLFNQVIEPIMVPFFFGVWELVSGILKLMDSAELKHEHLKCWSGFAFIGMIELFSGAMSMIKPFDDFVGINRVIAIIFFVQACGFFLKTVMAKYIITK